MGRREATTSPHTSLRGLLLGLWLALLLGHAPSAQGYLAKLDLVPLEPSDNQLDMTVSLTSPTVVSDTETTSVTGYLLAHLDGDPSSPYEGAITLIGGSVQTTDMHFVLPLNFGTARINLVDVVGVPDTPDPPGLVAAGTFDAEAHALVLNQGELRFLIPLVANSTRDLAEEPFTVMGRGTGTLELTDATNSAETSLPSVRITLPINGRQMLGGNRADATIDTTGLLVAQGELVRRGDVNGDGVTNNLDITSFVLALGQGGPVTESAIAAFAPIGNFLAADTDASGLVNNLDISPLINILGAEPRGTSALPEPSALAVYWVFSVCSSPGEGKVACHSERSEESLL